MDIEWFKEIEKVWGQEIWLVNCPEYCSKFLIVNEGAECSYHYHPKKKETFYCFEGYVTLTIEGKDTVLAPFNRPRTILPGEKHKFKGLTQSIILEVSTHHDEDDVVRLIESKKGIECSTL